MEAIHADDITDHYLRANESQRSIVSAMLKKHDGGSIHMVGETKEHISTFLQCDGYEGHSLCLAMVNSMRDQYGEVWVKQFLTAAQKLFL